MLHSTTVFFSAPYFVRKKQIRLLLKMIYRCFHWFKAENYTWQPSLSSYTSHQISFPKNQLAAIEQFAVGVLIKLSGDSVKCHLNLHAIRKRFFLHISIDRVLFQPFWHTTYSGKEMPTPTSENSISSKNHISKGILARRR